MQKKVFVSCMTKYMWMLPAEIVLMAVVSYTLVQGMDIISVVIDDKCTRHQRSLWKMKKKEQR